MGLIKTGLTLAGGYGLIKAASKAVNDYEDMKQRRSNQSQNQPQQQQQYSGHGSQMSHMQENQMYHYSSQPQHPHGNHNAHNIRDNARGFESSISQSPPPYHKAGGQAGSAQDYYSGEKL